MAREDIVAARRERRQKAKTARTTAPAPPARYRRKRDEPATAAVAVEEPYAHEAEIDPLDAQNAGLHDQALEQGHEEISLNLDEFDPKESGENAAGEEEKH